MDFQPVLTDSKNNPQFEPLRYEPRVFAHGAQGSYRVYSDKESFITVEADNAAQAFEKSGLTKAERIVREALILALNVLPEDVLLTPEMKASLAKQSAPPGSPDTAQPTANMTEVAASADIAENPNFMPDAMGILPEIVEAPPILSGSEPQQSTKNETDQELDEQEVKRLLGEG